MGENARFKNGHASVSKKCRRLLQALVDSVSVRFKNASVSKKMPLNIRMQWNAGTACVSECVLKTPACRGLRVGPSKIIRVFPGVKRGDKGGGEEGKRGRRGDRARRGKRGKEQEEKDGRKGARKRTRETLSLAPL